MDKLSLFNSKNLPANPYGDLKTGWTVKVFQKIKEGDKTRTQAFEGIIISKKHGSEPGGTIIVRKTTGGIGIEKTFPVYLPTITKIEVTKKSAVKKSKLYYLRDKTAREIKKKTKISSNTLNAAKTGSENQ